MKTVAIVGSPRKDGNCDILVHKFSSPIYYGQMSGQAKT